MSLMVMVMMTRESIDVVATRGTPTHHGISLGGPVEGYVPDAVVVAPRHLEVGVVATHRRRRLRQSVSQSVGVDARLAEKCKKKGAGGNRIRDRSQINFLMKMIGVCVVSPMNVVAKP